MSASGCGSGYIKNLVVFDRRLGCTDESATDEEQAEKILYYYPEDTSLYSQVRFLLAFAFFHKNCVQLENEIIHIVLPLFQLSRMTMIESLIEFSAKFSPDPIDIVLMEVCAFPHARIISFPCDSY